MTLDVLPEWEQGTVAVLSSGAGPPHAIPVSTALRIGPRTVVFALALRRESLARLRRDPRCALTVMAGGNIALTAHGRATIVEEPMAASDGVAAVRIDVEAIQDHGQDRFEIDAGVRWHWTDPDAEHRDREIRAALSRLAQ
jgi:Pyridoxamine 5'-phosphate oxidase